MPAMTLDDPRYPEFLERLTGPEGCNFRDDGATWDCAGGTDKSKSARILAAMGLNAEEIAATLAYFEARGGYCDCDVILNVFHTAADESLREPNQEGA